MFSWLWGLSRAPAPKGPEAKRSFDIISGKVLASGRIGVTCGDVVIDSPGSFNGTTLMIDGQRVDRIRKLVLTMELDKPTLLEVTRVIRSKWVTEKSEGENQ